MQFKGIKNMQLKIPNKPAELCLKITLSSALLFACGCVMTPEYEHPKNSLPKYVLEAKNFKYDKSLWKSATPIDDLPKGNWWKIFNDETLNALMEECDKNNPDITAAFYNVEKMRERAFVEESDLYPHINSRDYYMRDGRSDGFLPVPTGTYNSWVVGLGTTWDLDLFGRIQSMVVKERALVQASYNLYCNLMLSIHARIASEYFFARQCESEIKLLSDTLKVRKIQTEFAQKRLSLKFASKLDLSRAKVLEYEAASQLDYVKRQLDAAKNRIALLCGRSATDFELKCAPPSPTRFPTFRKCSLRSCLSADPISRLPSATFTPRTRNLAQIRRPSSRQYR